MILNPSTRCPRVARRRFCDAKKRRDFLWDYQYGKSLRILGIWISDIEKNVFFQILFVFLFYLSRFRFRLIPSQRRISNSVLIQRPRQRLPILPEIPFNLPPNPTCPLIKPFPLILNTLVVRFGWNFPFRFILGCRLHFLPKSPPPSPNNIYCKEKHAKYTHEVYLLHIDGYK